MAEQREPQASLADRAFAWGLATFGPKAEWRFRDRKLRLFQRLRREKGVHTVVDIGIGAGPDLALYGPCVDGIIGLDPNPAMFQYARAAAEAAGVRDKLQLVAGRAEALPMEDGTADAVVMTHVLCSVGDQAAALREALRVLRPGGCLVFLEHVAAPHGDRLRTWQHRLQPAVGFVARGCCCERDTLAAIRAAGFSSVEAEEFRLPLWLPAAVIAPHVAGVAVK